MEKTQHTALRMPEKTLKEIDRIAEQCGLSRSQLLRNLIEVGLSEVKTLERLGLLRISCSMRDFAEWVRKGKQLPLTEQENHENGR